MQSCPKLADIAIPQAPAAANCKQIWCWVTKIPWPHGGIMRKVSNSPLFFRFSPQRNRQILPLGLYIETSCSVLDKPNLPAKFVPGFQPLGCIKVSESAHLLPGHVDIYSWVEYRLWWHVKALKYRLQCLLVDRVWLSAVVKTAWKYKAENNVKM